MIDIQSESGERLLSTIDSILNISKLESERAFFNPTVRDINRIVNEASRSLKMLALNKGLELSVNLSEQPLNCFVDDSMLLQVLNNLISNAIKFTPSGEIIVTTVLKSNENVAAIVIKDTGVGISDEFIEELFQPYTMESGGADHGYGSSGLGLSISKRYVQMMGGSISVKSKKGAGSVFTVTLPINTSE